MNTHFGDRLREVLQYLFPVQQNAADFFTVSQATISRWLKMDRFSKKVLNNLKKLDDKGVNTAYFEDPSVSDWKKKPIKKEVDLETYQLQKQVIELQSELRSLEKKYQDLLRKSEGSL
jgi:predicted transcriptional regulator